MCVSHCPISSQPTFSPLLRHPDPFSSSTSPSPLAQPNSFRPSRCVPLRKLNEQPNSFRPSPCVLLRKLLFSPGGKPGHRGVGGRGIRLGRHGVPSTPTPPPGSLLCKPRYNTPLRCLLCKPRYNTPLGASCVRPGTITPLGASPV